MQAGRLQLNFLSRFLIYELTAESKLSIKIETIINYFAFSFETINNKKKSPKRILEHTDFITSANSALFVIYFHLQHIFSVTGSKFCSYLSWQTRAGRCSFFKTLRKNPFSRTKFARKGRKNKIISKRSIFPTKTALNLPGFSHFRGFSRQRLPIPIGLDIQQLLNLNKVRLSHKIPKD